MTPRRIDTGRSPYGWSTLQWVGVCDLRGALSAGAHLSNEERMALRAAPTRDVALIFGTLLHTALAHYHARRAIRRNGAVLVGDEVETDPEALMKPLVAARDAAQDADAALWEAGRAPAWQAELPRVIECMRAYDAERGREDLDVVAVESLSVRDITDEKTGETFEFTQRRDLIYRAHGLYFVSDHKSTASSASAFPGKVLDYTMHGQLIAMEKAGRLEWGDAFGGCTVNLVQSIPPYRSKILPLLSAPHAVARIDRNLMDRHRRLQALIRTRPDPMEWPTAIHEQVCRGRYGTAGSSAIERGLCPHYHECRLGGVARDTGTE